MEQYALSGAVSARHALRGAASVCRDRAAAGLAERGLISLTLPWRGRVDRVAIGVGWCFSTGTVREERLSPHPAAHFIRVDPPPPGEGEIPSPRNQEQRAAACRRRLRRGSMR